jgi:hypothetical protein
MSMERLKPLVERMLECAYMEDATEAFSAFKAVNDEFALVYEELFGPDVNSWTKARDGVSAYIMARKWKEEGYGKDPNESSLGLAKMLVGEAGPETV